MLMQILHAMGIQGELTLFHFKTLATSKLCGVRSSLNFQAITKLGSVLSVVRAQMFVSYEIVVVKGLAYAYFCILAYVATIVHLFVLLRFYTF